MSAELATQLKNYRVAMGTLQNPEETEEWQNPSAHIANDSDAQGFEEEEDENEEADLGIEPPMLYYSTQDMEELQQGWQETHQQELVELQRHMQSQLNAQALRQRFRKI